MRDRFMIEKDENIIENIGEEHGPYVADQKGSVRVVDRKYELSEGERFILREEYKKASLEHFTAMMRKAWQPESLNGPTIYKIAEMVHVAFPFFYDENRIFWAWNEEQSGYEITNETALMLQVESFIQDRGTTLSSGVKNQFLEAFRRIGMKKKPKDAPVKWLQFKNRAYSLSSGKIYDVQPNYFFTNPIPWNLGKAADTPFLDNLFEEWVGPANVPVLYEIIAYCCYRDYPIHRLFCLIGSGRNGKSTFLRILERFLGSMNTAACELDSILDSHFESFKLYRKLLCAMGETNFNVIRNTSLLKKLVGQDFVGFQKKYCDPFDARNYAKIVMASNSLPGSKDTSDGFYRRWLVVDFQNEFSEGKDILQGIPDAEYEALALKCTKILPKLLSRGTFFGEGNIDQRRQKYIMESNPLNVFIDQCYEKGEEYFCNYAEFVSKYLKFLREKKKRRVVSKEIYNALEEEGYWVEKTSKEVGTDEGGEARYKSTRWIIGIRENGIMPIMPKFTVLQPYNFSPIEKVENTKNQHNQHKWSQGDRVYLKCTVEGCQGFECKFDSYGRPYCKKHQD